MKKLSLFSGIGGIDLAAHWAGMETVAFVEREPFCQTILKKNFPGIPIHDDITTFDGTEYEGIDIVSAGFPCQPHSVAGKRLASRDERDLWGETVRVLRESKPRWFLGENVPGLLSSESGHFFGRVINDLVSLGFRVGWGVLSAAEFGAVHRRERVFIVAYANSRRLEDGRTENSSEVQRCAEGTCSTTIVCSTSPESSFSHVAYSNHSNSKRRSIRNKFERESFIEQLLPFFTDSDRISGFQADSSTMPTGKEWGSWNNAGSRDWRPFRDREWDRWDVKPVVCRGDDGVSRKLDKSRLKALGNAVCPQQVFPILKAIKEVW